MIVILIIALIGIATSRTTCKEAMISNDQQVTAYDTQYCRTLYIRTESGYTTDDDTHSDDDTDSDDDTNSATDSNTEDNQVYYRCCYAVGKTDNGTVRGCVPLTYWQYGHPDDNITITQSDYKYKVSDIEIHCNSKYLTAITLLIPLVFVFF